MAIIAVRDFLNNYQVMMENLPERASVYFLPIEKSIADKKYPMNYLCFNLEISAIVENLIFRCKIQYAKKSLLFSSMEREQAEIRQVRQKFEAFISEIKVEFANHKNLFEICDGRILTPEEAYKDA